MSCYYRLWRHLFLGWAKVFKICSHDIHVYTELKHLRFLITQIMRVVKQSDYIVRYFNQASACIPLLCFIAWGLAKMLSVTSRRGCHPCRHQDANHNTYSILGKRFIFLVCAVVPETCIANMNPCILYTVWIILHFFILIRTTIHERKVDVSFYYSILGLETLDLHIMLHIQYSNNI